MNNMMTNMYMDKQGTHVAKQPSSQNENELIDISSDESDSEAGIGKKSSKPKGGGKHSWHISYSIITILCFQ